MTAIKRIRVCIYGGTALQGAPPEFVSSDLKECYEAWVPERRLDSRSDFGGAVRLDEHDGVTVRVMTGRTTLGRRLAMFAGVDIVLIISGKQHTEVVVEQALHVGITVLPIPDAGGNSKVLLD